jgi:hypothetical protein
MKIVLLFFVISLVTVTIYANEPIPTNCTIHYGTMRYNNSDELVILYTEALEFYDPTTKQDSFNFDHKNWKFVGPVSVVKNATCYIHQNNNEENTKIVSTERVLSSEPSLLQLTMCVILFLVAIACVPLTQNSVKVHRTCDLALG